MDENIEFFAEWRHAWWWWHD